MFEYRKRVDSDTWHWCKNCSHWPTKNYVYQYAKPTTSGALCAECVSKQRTEDCAANRRYKTP